MTCFVSRILCIVIGGGGTVTWGMFPRGRIPSCAGDYYAMGGGGKMVWLGSCPARNCAGCIMYQLQSNPIHFTSLHFHFTSLHFTSLHFTSLRFASLHFTSLRFASLHFTSLHFNALQWFQDTARWAARRKGGLSALLMHHPIPDSQVKHCHISCNSEASLDLQDCILLVHICRAASIAVQPDGGLHC